MRTAINPEAVPVSPYYAQAIEVTGSSRQVYVSGQVGVTADGSVCDGIAAQSAQAIANLNAVLAEAGLDASDIVKMTIYLTDPEHVGPFMAAAGPTLPAEPPATTLLVVQALGGPDLLVEVEAIAAA